MASGTEARTGTDVIDLAKGGNLDAIGAVRQAGRDLGEVLSTCVSLMNPSVIAIGGSMARAGEHLLAGVREIVYSRSMPRATEHLHIVPSTSAARAGVLGGKRPCRASGSFPSGHRGIGAPLNSQILDAARRQLAVPGIFGNNGAGDFP